MGNSFDKEAKSWDENPKRLTLVEQVWTELNKGLNLKGNESVLDYGCGTGLLGYKFINKVQEVTFCDTSIGMLEQVASKRDYYNYRNVKIINKDLVHDEPLIESKFDLITTMLAMHHIERVDIILSKFATLLNNGGSICWIDLVEEDGSFHSDNAGIFHFGFKRSEIEELFKNAGFRIDYYSTEIEMRKESEGQKRKYPIFVALASKQNEF